MPSEAQAPVAPGNPARRFGFVAVIGAPNAGKSTLVNMLVGAKVTIVSHKVQTTRVRVRGITIEGDSQIVLVDTPGIFAPRRRLDRAMVHTAWQGAGEGDAIVLVADAARGESEELDAILTRLKGSMAPKVLVLNKVDRLEDKAKLLDLAKQLSAKVQFDDVMMVSALSGDGVKDLRRYLAAKMPLGPWHYPEDDISDVPLRMLAAEITREKLFVRLHDELPYGATVETTQWKELKDGSVRIEQTVLVEREGHRKIALGKGGQTIKAISSEARRELIDVLERNVHLFLFVKVRESWSEDPAYLREMGLELPKE